MTNLKSVTIGQNKFCGPAVLSILTGKDTDTCANVISQINGNYNIKGVIINDLIKAAERLGFETKINLNVVGHSLYRTLISLVNTDGMYIVMVTGHFVCIEVKDKQIYFCDNHTKQPIPAASSARLSMQVLGCYQVTKSKNEEIIKEIDKVTKLHDEQWQFEMAVEATCLEVTMIAKRISSQIMNGISLVEAQEMIIREFRDRLRK